MKRHMTINGLEVVISYGADGTGYARANESEERAEVRAQRNRTLDNLRGPACGYLQSRASLQAKADELGARLKELDEQAAEAESIALKLRPTANCDMP